jgi:hypothetical protein
VLAAAIAARAALWLNHLANEADSTTVAYLLTGAICGGAVTYLFGTLIGYGGLAVHLRWVGWIVIALPLVVPSTFSIALPLVALLAVTLRPLPSRPEGEQAARSSPRLRNHNRFGTTAAKKPKPPDTRFSSPAPRPHSPVLSCFRQNATVQLRERHGRKIASPKSLTPSPSEQARDRGSAASSLNAARPS